MCFRSWRGTYTAPFLLGTPTARLTYRPSRDVFQVLEGYVYLGNVGSLGEEVMAAFAAVVGAAALKVARGVVLTRPTPGLEERVKSTQLLQELVKWVPADLFRTCLTRVRSIPP